MKKFIAYFPDCNAAHAAAFEISEGNDCGDIVVSEQTSEKAGVPSFIFRAIITGTLLGYLCGAVLSIFGGAGLNAQLSTVSGIILGSVLGAITGALLDITAYDLAPVCSTIRFTAPQKDCALLIRRLKRRGAVKIAIVKQK